MKKQEKIALINKKQVTGDLLYKQTCKLTNLSQELKLAVDFIDHLCVDSRVNKDALNAFISSAASAMQRTFCEISSMNLMKFLTQFAQIWTMIRR